MFGFVRFVSLSFLWPWSPVLSDSCFSSWCGMRSILYFLIDPVELRQCYYENKSEMFFRNQNCLDKNSAPKTWTYLAMQMRVFFIFFVFGFFKVAGDVHTSRNKFHGTVGRFFPLSTLHDILLLSLQQMGGNWNILDQFYWLEWIE